MEVKLKTSALKTLTHYKTRSCAHLLNENEKKVKRLKRVELRMLESGKTSNLSHLNDAKEAVNQKPRSTRPEN